MDRNVVIATILIVLILFVWMYFLTPPPPPPPTAEDGTLVDSVTAVEPGRPAPEIPAITAPPQVVADSSIASALQGEERFITVDTDYYEARFSTKGGTLRLIISRRGIESQVRS